MDSNSIVQPNLDQQEFDKEMAKQTPQQYRAMIKGLGELARSKVTSASSSSSTETVAWWKRNEQQPPE